MEEYEPKFHKYLKKKCETKIKMMPRYIEIWLYMDLTNSGWMISTEKLHGDQSSVDLSLEPWFLRHL